MLSAFASLNWDTIRFSMYVKWCCRLRFSLNFFRSWLLLSWLRLILLLTIPEAQFLIIITVLWSPFSNFLICMLIETSNLRWIRNFLALLRFFILYSTFNLCPFQWLRYCARLAANNAVHVVGYLCLYVSCIGKFFAFILSRNDIVLFSYIIPNYNKVIAFGFLDLIIYGIAFRFFIFIFVFFFSIAFRILVNSIIFFVRPFVIIFVLSSSLWNFRFLIIFRGRTWKVLTIFFFLKFFAFFGISVHQSLTFLLKFLKIIFIIVRFLWICFTFFRFWCYTWLFFALILLFLKYNFFFSCLIVVIGCFLWNFIRCTKIFCWRCQ